MMSDPFREYGLKVDILNRTKYNVTLVRIGEKINAATLDRKISP